MLHLVLSFNKIHHQFVLIRFLKREILDKLQIVQTMQIFLALKHCILLCNYSGAILTSWVWMDVEEVVGRDHDHFECFQNQASLKHVGTTLHSLGNLKFRATRFELQAILGSL
jgi:hypothetical protein